MKQFVMILMIMQFAMGQQTKEGIPYSQIHGLENNYHTITLPKVDVNALLKEDTYREMGTPFRYGFTHEVLYSPENSGVWKETSDGGILWQVRFTSEDAFAISFEFEEFYIPEGGELYVYNHGYEIIYGAYTHLNNTEHRHFSTPLLKGDRAIIEKITKVFQ